MFLNKHTYKFLKDLLRVIKPEMDFLNTESEESVRSQFINGLISIPSAQKHTSSAAGEKHTKTQPGLDDDIHKNLSDSFFKINLLHFQVGLVSV